MKETIQKMLEDAPGSKGKEIAKKLGLNKKQVNQFLYSNSEHFVRDDEYCWFLVPSPEIRIEFEANQWMDCLSFENSLLGAEELLSGPTKEICFIIPENCKILLDAAARFLALCNQLISANKNVTIDFNDCKTTLSYFNRIGFIDHLSPHVSILPYKPRTSGAQRYKGNSDTVVEFGALNPEEVDKSLINQLTDRFVQQSNSKFETAASTVFGELIVNVSEHSQTPIPGFAALQKYGGRRNHIQTVISDSGVGIGTTLKPSLREHYPDVYNLYRNDESDVKLVVDVLTKGELSRFGTGRGLGFKSSREQATKFDARLSVRQENFSLCIEYIDGKIQPIDEQNNLQTIYGTHLCFDFFVD
jgi:hypothetical protein